MKTTSQLLVAALLAASAVAPAWGQNFDTGSNGSLGALNVVDADQVVDLPPDGRLHYTTVTVAAGRTLRFNRNALNTPVFLLAQGDVVINGVINVSGSQAPGSPPIGGVGGPGGFDGGKPGFGAAFPPGDGYGPGGGGAHPTDINASSGGGHNGAGAGGAPGAAYGSPLLIPLMGGSGGGGQVGNPGRGGGGGGGAILIASNTRIAVTGSGGFVLANGGPWVGNSHNGGSGGAIRLLAPRVEGNGQINVSGGANGGANGRIRVDCFDKRALSLNFQPAFAVTVGANMFVEATVATSSSGGLGDGNSNTIIIGERVVPRLDIIDAAGTSIPLNTATPVQVLLPFGSSPNRTVTVRAQHFNADVPIRLVLTPDSGSRTVIDTNIVNPGLSNPAQVVIPVTLPLNNLVTLHAWTR